jgi:hypothetical protein
MHHAVTLPAATAAAAADDEVAFCRRLAAHHGYRKDYQPMVGDTVTAAEATMLAVADDDDLRLYAAGL